MTHRHFNIICAQFAGQAAHSLIEICWANPNNINGVLNPDVGNEDAFELKVLEQQFEISLQAQSVAAKISQDLKF